MIFPNKDLPESATVSLDVPKGAAFKLLISTDYREEKDNFGNTVIIHNSEKVYNVTQDFRETILFDSEEQGISVKLTCTKIESINENSSNSVRSSSGLTVMEILTEEITIMSIRLNWIRP